MARHDQLCAPRPLRDGGAHAQLRAAAQILLEQVELDGSLRGDLGVGRHDLFAGPVASIDGQFVARAANRQGRQGGEDLEPLSNVEQHDLWFRRRDAGDDVGSGADPHPADVLVAPRGGDRPPREQELAPRGPGGLLRCGVLHSGKVNPVVLSDVGRRRLLGRLHPPDHQQRAGDIRLVCRRLGHGAAGLHELDPCGDRR
mmetsp:Transcript_51108/g.143670  ORF Transcript_51108/g.143670 Transcript_51108/m.143670 type:complete len:200 (+) Transcript_51108:630-1229(+)